MYSLHLDFHTWGLIYVFHWFHSHWSLFLLEHQLKTFKLAFLISYTHTPRRVRWLHFLCLSQKQRYYKLFSLLEVRLKHCHIIPVRPQIDYDYSAHTPSGLFSDRLHQVLRLLILPTKLRLFIFYNNCHIYILNCTIFSYLPPQYLQHLPL